MRAARMHNCRQSPGAGSAVAEVERYVMNPGQACSYMIGELKIVGVKTVTVPDGTYRALQVLEIKDASDGGTQAVSSAAIAWQIERVWQLAYGTAPTAQELTAASWSNPVVAKVVRAGMIGWLDLITVLCRKAEREYEALA